MLQTASQGQRVVFVSVQYRLAEGGNCWCPVAHVYPSSFALQSLPLIWLSRETWWYPKWWQVTVWQILQALKPSSSVSWTLTETSITAFHAVIPKGWQCRSTPQELQSDGDQRRSLNLRPEGEGRLPGLSSMPECVSVSPGLRSLEESTSRALHPDEYFRCRVTLFWQAFVFFSVAVATQTRLSRRRRNDGSGKSWTDELICQRVMSADVAQNDKVRFNRPSTIC